MARRLLVAVSLVCMAGCGGNPAPNAAGDARHLTLGGTYRGRLVNGDPLLPNSGRPSQVWTFEGQAGQRLVIEMLSRSGNVDPHLVLQDSSGKELARDDDGGDGTNARLRYVLRAAGRYRVVASNFRASRYGPFTLTMSEAAPLVTSMTGVRGTVGRGETRTATLSRGDAAETRVTGVSVSMDRSGRVTSSNVRTVNVEYHVWLLAGAAGDSVSIELRGAHIDPLLILQEADGHELERHSGNRATARLALRLPYAGTYRIVATTGSAPYYGTYTLTVH